MRAITINVEKFIELKKSMKNHTINSEACVLYDRVRKVFEEVLRHQIMCADCALNLGCSNQLRPWRAIHTCFVPKAVMEEEPYENYDSKIKRDVQ